MKRIHLFQLLLTALLLVMLGACRKDSCYDEQLYQQHKNDVCTLDCPGVTGCDGQFYCNACEAQRKGIKVR